MNFKILKEVIVMLKKKLRCPGCGKQISNREISIEGIKAEGALIKCDCKRCEAKTIVEISLVESKELGKAYNEAREPQGLQVRAKTIPTVSQNDVLDIKNFLKSFQGDFKEIFKA